MAAKKRVKKKAARVALPLAIEFTPAHARLICEAHDIGEDGVLDGEEAELLEANNPELFEAYKALLQFALKP